MTQSLPTILTIGNFDGLHVGHRHLISTTIAVARSWGGRAVLMTFHPHPKQFFHPVPHFFIHPVSVHEKILSALGLDQILYLPFGDICQLSPESFFEDVVMPLDPAAIVLGDNFSFGHHKSGNIDRLRQMCASRDVALHALPRFALDASPVSSTRIRTAIQEGHVSAATSMLGEPYTLYDVVREGARRGHTLGFATANIRAEEQVLPQIGVYVTHVDVEDAVSGARSVTAVTRTPTFGGTETVVETHILNFTGDIYGRKIRVHFDDFLRDEHKFDSKEALMAQLYDDCAKAAQY